MSEEPVVGGATSRAAVLIDFEDLVTGAEESLPATIDPVPFAAVELLCRTYGNTTVRRAYADWSQSRFNRYQEGLLLNGIDLTHVTRIRAGHKNTAEMRLAVDAMELIFTRPDVEVFVLVAGDGDYTPVVQRLRQLGKYVVGVGTDVSRGSHVVSACSEYRYWPTLVAQVEPRARLAAQAEFDLADAERLLVDAVRRSNLPVLAVVLRTRILTLDPSFDERNYGFGSFHDFLRHMSHLVHTRQEAYDAVVTLSEATGSGDPWRGEPATPAHGTDVAAAPALLAELRAHGADLPLRLEDRNALLGAVHQAWRAGRLDRVRDIGDALLDPELGHLPTKRTRLGLECALVTGDAAVIPLAERPMPGRLPLRRCTVGRYDGSPRAQWMSRAHVAWLAWVMARLERRNVDHDLAAAYFADAPETGSALVALARRAATDSTPAAHHHCHTNP